METIVQIIVDATTKNKDSKWEYSDVYNTIYHICYSVYKNQDRVFTIQETQSCPYCKCYCPDGVLLAAKLGIRTKV
jgi:hypothetical protein